MSELLTPSPNEPLELQINGETLQAVSNVLQEQLSPDQVSSFESTQTTFNEILPFFLLSVAGITITVAAINFYEKNKNYFDNLIAKAFEEKQTQENKPEYLKIAVLIALALLIAAIFIHYDIFNEAYEKYSGYEVRK